MTPPSLDLPRIVATAAGDPLATPLDRGASFPAFRTMDGAAEAHWPTFARAGWDDAHLHVELACRDDDAWATLRGRDEPLWTEEVVELFLAAGPEVPSRYFELEINPLGAIFDARIDNPHGDRRAMAAETGWSCHGLLSRVERVALGGRADWRVRLAIPWRGLELDRPPRVLRANLYRVERPRGGEDELSGWSPTLTAPPDFHRPDRFGFLRLFD